MITILILVILAGVTIVTLKNTNLFNNALKAKEKSDYEAAKEAIELKLSAINTEYEINGNGKSKLQYTAERLDPDKDSDIDYVRAEYEEEASIQGIKQGQKITKIYTKLKEYKYEFEINDNIQIASIDGKAVNENSKHNETTKKIIANPKEYIGKEVKWKTKVAETKDITWEILYADDDGVYLISNDYVNIISQVPAKDNIKINGGTYNISWDNNFNQLISKYSGTDNQGTNNKIGKWYAFNGNTNDNSKYSDYLLDTTLWSTLYNGEGIKWCIGGMTVEMITTVLKEYGINVNIELRDSGYGPNNNQTIYVLPQSLKNILYIADTSKAKESTVIAPSYYSGTQRMMGIGDFDGVIRIVGGTWFDGGNYDNRRDRWSTIGFRPVICLNKDTEILINN